MFRLIHNQSSHTPGAIFVDDIDDGLPNKEVHRLGSTADPNAYERDGYANKSKQPAYIPRTKLYPVADPTIQGYIDLNQTKKVNLSAGKGKIKKLQQAGFITVVSFVASDLIAPHITGAVLGVGPADITVTGTKFLSLTPNFSLVTLTGNGAAVITQAQILTAGGTFNDTTIVIPAALCGGTTSPGTAVVVTADDKNSNSVGL